MKKTTYNEEFIMEHKLIMENWRKCLKEWGAYVHYGDDFMGRKISKQDQEIIGKAQAKLNTWDGPSWAKTKQALADITTLLDPTGLVGAIDAKTGKITPQYELVQQSADAANLAWEKGEYLSAGMNSAGAALGALAMIPVLGKIPKFGSKMVKSLTQVKKVSKQLKKSGNPTLIKKSQEIDEKISALGNLSGYQKSSSVKLYSDTIASIQKLIRAGKAASHQGVVFRGVEAVNFSDLTRQIKIPGVSDKQAALIFRQAYRKASQLADQGSNKFFSVPMPKNTKAKIVSSNRIEGGASFSKDIEKAHLFSRNRGIYGGDSSGDVVLLIKAKAKTGNNVDIIKTYELNPEVAKRFSVGGDFKKTDIGKEREVIMFSDQNGMIEVEEILIRWKKADNSADTFVGKGRYMLDQDLDSAKKGVREGEQNSP